MAKIILTGVDGNLGSVAAAELMKLTEKENLLFCGYNTDVLASYAREGVETQQTDFNNLEGLADKFIGADVLALISMPFVGEKRQRAHKNVVDAAKEAGVKKIIYTSLVNAADVTNPSIEKIDHAFTENYIKKSNLDYIFLRNSQYAEAMITNYFTFVNQGSNLQNNQGEGKMAYISRKDCAKAVAYALLADNLHHKILNINGKQLLTISEFIEIGNEKTGNHVKYQFVSDEENYTIFDSMGVPRTTEGQFKKDSEAPFSSDGMVTFGQAIRENKMSNFTKDFEYLTGDEPISVQFMFEHSEKFQIGQRHSLDK
ncbi:NmrA family NAD(P)-binding protein [Liquorilactobacillus hordei]|uniref:Nucleoside-diphosphate sugar epimerase n=1 Tax=Liquorilactobacillus hordei TaxID=468911 RepID=A0A3S6QNX2_9LACO|nr:NmrA family NAD(P)-binding protein [Liquorilactobacillus hordei]AUJ29712.1 nucleoside-diphosphate sugar epimerase [Liquorilactobacillus hordei]